MNSNFVIIIEGPMGSGKSTIASILHSQLPRTALLGTDKIKDVISDFNKSDEDYYLATTIMLAMARIFLENKFSLLIPQAFLKKEYADPFIKIAEEFNVKLHFYHLHAPEDELRARIIQRAHDKNVSLPTDDKIKKNFNKWRDNHYEYGKKIDISDQSSLEVADLILRELHLKPLI